MAPSSRSLARTWPYPRHRNYVKQVRKAAVDWFKSKDYQADDRYPFILSEWNAWPQNIILPEVAEYIQEAAESQRKDGLNFPLHKYIHHGLSSQAMLFNLVGPLLVQGDLSPLKAVLAEKDVTWPGDGSIAMFEYEDRSVFNEDSGQPTSIDLVITGRESKPEVFIESKFTEHEFGGCSVFAAGDCDGQNPSGNLDLCYLHHIGRKYWSLMKKYEMDGGAIGQDAICIMANHYQFFRELLFALEHEGVFVLLCDDRSPVFYVDGSLGTRGVMPFLLGLLPESLRGKVSQVTIQELMVEIKLSSNHSWVGEFERKYGLECSK